VIFLLMRLTFTTILLLSLLAATATAGEDRRRDQIQAAHVDALASMMDTVRATRVQGDLTVGQFLDRTGGDESLRQSLQRKVQQIGATRWPNPETCQVQLEVSGGEVAAALVTIATDQPDRSPLPAEALRKALAGWEARTFSASGAAMTPEQAGELRPGPEQPLWLSVPEADRKAAVQAAQFDAGRRAIEELDDVPLGGGKTVSDALQLPEVRKTVQDWLAGRPVVDIRFGEDGEVLVTLAAPAEEMWSVFRGAISAQNEIPVPQDEAGWQRLHDAVVARLKMPTGRGAVADRRERPERPVVWALAAQPPKWVGEQMNAEGVATGGSASLLLARAAEARATDDLRARVKKLPLSDGRTIGDAAAADRQVAAAVERGLRRARTSKVDYSARDTAKVTIGLDLRYVWQELQNVR
jgi:hypothetical protein